METDATHSQRVQTKGRRKHSRRARIKRALAECSQRLAFSPFEFAVVLGRSETWAYRQLYSGTLKAISDAGGRLLIPRAEMDRFLSRAAPYKATERKVTSVKQEV